MLGAEIKAWGSETEIESPITIPFVLFVALDLASPDVETWEGQSFALCPVCLQCEQTPC